MLEAEKLVESPNSPPGPPQKSFRRHGDERSYAIPVWNGLFDHYRRIGEAVWEFLWCLDAVTKEMDSAGIVYGPRSDRSRVNGDLPRVGMVLGGAPVKLQKIVADLKGSDKETVRRHLKKLVDEGYIRARRTPYGQIIEVLNSKKWGAFQKGAWQKPQNAVSLEKPIHEPEKPIHESKKPQNAVSKEDSAVTQQTDSAGDRRHDEHTILTDDDKLAEFLFETFRPDPRFPDVRREVIERGIVTIRDRAKSPPGSTRFWTRSMEKYLLDLPYEIRALGQRRELQSELRVGAGPSCANPVKKKAAAG